MIAGDEDAGQGVFVALFSLPVGKNIFRSTLQQTQGERMALMGDNLEQM
jgi:hypothetical protein